MPITDNEGLDVLGVAPSQDASHHQIYYIFRIGDSYKPSFTTVTGRGPHPMYAMYCYVYITYSNTCIYTYLDLLDMEHLCRNSPKTLPILAEILHI